MLHIKVLLTSLLFLLGNELESAVGFSEIIFNVLTGSIILQFYISY